MCSNSFSQIFRPYGSCYYNLTEKKKFYRKNKKRRFSKLGTDLRDFLTGEERRQMDRLLEKAEERMKEKGEGSYNEQFLFMTCQCKCKQVLEKEEEKERFEEEVRKIFASICTFCKGHDLCQEYCVEELPFP